MRKAFLILFVFMIGIWSCIPIEDRLNPSIITAEVEPIYRILDTMRIPVDYSDNEQLDSFVVKIEKVDIASNQGQLWSVVKIDTIRGGRRYQDTVQIPIPQYANPGLYTITFECYDFSLNSAQISSEFELRRDIIAPTFQNFQVVNASDLEIDTDGNYLTCYAETIEIDAQVWDNTKVNRVTIYMLDSKQDTVETREFLTEAQGADTINIIDLIGRSLKIPDNIPDNEVLTFSFEAIDENGNTSTFSIPNSYKIACDTRPPLIVLDSLNPQFESYDEATNTYFLSLRNGTSFEIIDAYFTDNYKLQDFQIEYAKSQGNTGVTTLKEQSFFLADSDVDTVQIPMLLGDFNLFTIPENAAQEEEYLVTMQARDTVGNASDLKINITVTENSAPIIAVTNILINDDIAYNPTLSTHRVSIGDKITLKGKISDTEESLEYVNFYWRQEASDDVPNTVITSDLITNYPLDFEAINETIPSFPPLVPSFTVPQNAVIGARYELKIEVKDAIDGNIVEKLYIFIIEE